MSTQKLNKKQQQIKSFVDSLDVSAVLVQFGETEQPVDKNVIVVTGNPTIQPVDKTDEVLDNDLSINNEEVDEMKQKVLDLIEEMGLELAYQKLTAVAVTSTGKKSFSAEQVYLEMYKANNKLERKDFVNRAIAECEMGHNYATTFWQNMRKKHGHNK